MIKDTYIPEGERFLEFVWAQEDECEAQTDSRIPSLGRKAPACLKHLGAVLSLLDRMASCWWMCHQGKHRIEYLCGRSASNARVVLRLLRFGFYDEALVLCRGLGEVANLMQLFVYDRKAFDEWENLSPQQIRREFTPVKVRLRLESLSMSPAIDEECYRLLSERAAHVHPGTRPQSYNILGVPFVGARIQDEGILVCLNELAVPLSLITAFGANVLKLDQATTKRIISCSRTLAEQIGGVTLSEIEDCYRQALMNPIVAEKTAIAEDLL